MKPLTEQGQALDTPPDYQPPAASIQDTSKASQHRRILAGLIEAGANGITTMRQPVLDDYGRKHSAVGRYVLIATPNQKGGGND